MRQTKLFQALQQLPKTEHNRFKKYLGSPYFNVNETQTRLAHLIIQEIQSPTSKSWEKEQIWEALRLDTAYDDVRFRKYFSDLLKNLENFLALRQFEDHEESRRLFLLEAVEQRKLSVLYNSSLRVIRDHFQKSPFRNSDFYYGNFMLEKRFYDLAGFEHNRTAQSNWEEISRNLDYFYIAEKLWIFCNVLARKDLSSHEYKLDLMSEIVNYVENNQLQHIPPIAIYYQVLNLYRFPEEQQHYHQLKRLLDEYGMNFPKEEASDLYSLAQNYCIHQLNRGNTLFLTELFALYQSVLERRIIFRDDQLSPWDFRNIVVVGLRVGDYDWTLKFIEEYLQFLPSENRENARSFNLAQVYFYQKKYERVVELLRFVEYEDISYNLNSKDMLLRVYYDTDEWDPLYSLFESFRTYLNRNKDIPERNKEAYKNLIGFTKKLTRLHRGDAQKIDRLKLEIQSCTNVANQKWLLEKIDEFQS